MLAVFKLVRERGLINMVPELILLTSKVILTFKELDQGCPILYLVIYLPEKFKSIPELSVIIKCP